MATASTPTRNPATDAGVLNSPPSRRSAAAARGVSSPWTQVVRGGESDSVSAAATVLPPSSPSSSGVPSQEQIVNACLDMAAAASSSSSTLLEDSSLESQQESAENSGGGNAGKKPAWNKPSNGAIEVSPVMGAVSWPALSESTRASPKSSSSDSLKNVADGSVSSSQVTGLASSSTHKQVSSNNANPNSAPNHVGPTRQRSMKRGGGSSSNSVSANGGFTQPPAAQGPVVEVTPGTPGKSTNAPGESSSRDNSHREGGQRGGFSSQSHSGGEHQQHRVRRGNGGPHPRGDGSYNHGYGGRRDQDRGNQEWNSHRSFGGRDGNTQTQRVHSRPIMRGPPHAPPPYMPAPAMPMRPFGPVVYSEVPPLFYVPTPHPDALRAMPIIPQVQPMYFSVPDPLPTKILNQIDYYFSNDNLIKDTFLRQNMDDQGWVPVKLIAGFKKVSQLTDNVQLILDAVRSSIVVEVQGDKLRKRNDWMRWIMPSSAPYASASSPLSIQKSSHDMLAAHLQGVVLDDSTITRGNAEAFLSRSSSGELSSHSQQSGGDVTIQVTAQPGQPTSAANLSK